VEDVVRMTMQEMRSESRVANAPGVDRMTVAVPGKQSPVSIHQSSRNHYST
jgi:hypothetical protein